MHNKRLEKLRGEDLKYELSKLKQSDLRGWLRCELYHGTIINKGEYRCVYFSLSELVDKPTRDFLGEEGSWALFDVEMLMTLDWLRVEYGPASINTGKHQSRGFRHPGSKFYSPTSMHSVGKAFDLIFHKVSAQHVRELIMARLEANIWLPKLIRRIETQVHWFHFDSKETYAYGNGILQQSLHNKVYFFNPG